MRKRNLVAGVNVIGLRRAGMPREEIDHVRWAFRVIYEHHNSRPIIIEELRTRSSKSSAIRVMLDFLTRVDGPIAKAERYEEVEVPDDAVPPPVRAE